MAISPSRSRSGGTRRNNVDTKIEILAEAASADPILEVIVGGANQPEIDFLGGTATEALHGAFLQDAQELALEARMERGDLVEENRAGVGCLDQSGLRGIGTGEGTLFIAE